ncbi:thiamine phosphate synthase [Lacimicrobium alkaliphilum]|uniref:Thiamine-phosphate synthase n=1 Tax=Lacimicrobium alkaliphilum TaxID=1526571 RepID=A0ABQ1RCG0_9ALTE|nr:thiamine phosphate synthase [Lacimicrobium alkaliphilum]GGD65852.1 bifunctional hydroxymethylpyrimidine kinase/phosphomethylpyrimidine kinase [Lacimicrobium alkaliphilum]
MGKPIIWCIGGSDSGGGAGIQADLLTVHGLGGHGCSLISAITAQNSHSIDRIQAVSVDMLRSQLNSLAGDMLPRVVKIGMLADSGQIRLLAEFIGWLRQQQPALFVIWDPVVQASSGAKLSNINARDCVPLLQQLDLITPNADELNWLTDIRPDNKNNMEKAANALLSSGVTAALIKGGHLHWQQQHCTDYYFSEEQRWQLTSDRIATSHGHGTGCVYASAIATAIALDYPLADAACIASAYINQGLKSAAAVGRGPGPVAHLGWPEKLADFPTYQLNPEPTPAVRGFATLTSRRLGLYPVVDTVEWVQQCLQWGITTLQLRLKRPPDEEAEAAIQQAVALANHHQARLFINDHWQLAIKHGAFGVHLGQEDLYDADLNAIQQAGLALGISTHGYAELLRAIRLCPSYIALGHIFATRTKDMPSSPQGLARLKAYQVLQQSIPTVAIGGISQSRVDKVLACGVDGIAMVSAITAAENPQQVAKGLMEKMERYYAQ